MKPLVFDYQPFRYFSLFCSAISFAMLFTLAVTIWCLVFATASLPVLAYLQTL